MKMLKRTTDLTMRRDGGRCVSCGTQAGVGVYLRRVADAARPDSHAATPADLVTMCRVCVRLDQRTAAAFGWKIRDFTATPNAEVPIFYRDESQWCLVDVFGARDAIHPADARERIVLAGGAMPVAAS